MRKYSFCTVALSLMVFLTACTPTATGPATAPTGDSSLKALSAASFTTGEAFEALPPGDVMLTIDAGTLLNTTIPTALATSPQQKQEFDKALVEMQEKAGIDPKQLKLVAMTFVMPKTNAEKLQFAAVMTGTFDTAKLTEALKKDSKTGAEVPSQDYNGQTLFVKQDEGQEIAASVLDSSMLVLGSPATMAKQAIDARAGKAGNATQNADLFNLFKATSQTGVLRFAMRFPQEQLPQNQNDPTVKSFAAIKYLYGTLDASAGLGLDLNARTGSAAEAQPLHDNLQQLLAMGKQQVAGNAQMASLASVLEQTTVTMTDADVKLKMSIPPTTLAQVAADFQKMSGAFGGAPGAPPMMEPEDKP